MGSEMASELPHAVQSASELPHAVQSASELPHAVQSVGDLGAQSLCRLPQLINI